MLDHWYKITAVAAALVIIVSAVLGPTIGMVFWLAQLDRDVTDLQTDVADLQTDVTDLQTDVTELQTDVAELQTDVAELQRGQAVMLDILRTLADEIPAVHEGLSSHTHDADGRVQLPVSR